MGQLRMWCSRRIHGVAAVRFIGVGTSRKRGTRM